LLRAFAVHAIDYLLKPLTHRRFQDALRRARATMANATHAESAERLRRLLEARDAEAGRAAAAPAQDQKRTEPYVNRFTVRDGDRFILVRAADIDWVEADANYLRLHVGAKSFPLRMTMAELETKLDPRQFARIHRSAVVNLDGVASINPDWHGAFDVVLTTGAALRLSRTYRDRLF
jgi:two-component system LytT family response regulator